MNNRVVVAAARRIKRREEALVYLGGRCAHCGGKDELQFDHINRLKQNFRIGRRLDMSWKRLKKELNLCQLLCVKCHRIKTNIELGWKSGHGSASSYNNESCRCDPCTKAWTQYIKARRDRLRLA